MKKIIFFGAYDINARIPLVNELRTHGIDVELAGIGATPATADSNADGVVTHAVGRGDLKREFLKLPGMIRRLRRDRGADLVHTWDSIPGMLANRAADGDRQGVYTRTVTGTGQSFATGGAKGFALRHGYGSAQVVARKSAAFTVFQNTDDHRQFLEHGWVAPTTSMVIPGSGVKLQGFDAVRSSGRGDEMRRHYEVGDRYLVVLATRLLKAKGVAEFCDAARMCDGKLGRSALFLIVGPEEPNPKRAAAVTPFVGTEVEVRYGGNCPDIPGLLSTTDLLVHPTAYGEGIPRILLEAAASEVPIIASDWAGCRDVVVHDATGLLVPARSTAPIADAVIRLAHDDVLATDFGHAARLRVEGSMTLEIIAGQYADLFHQLLANRPAVKESIS